MMYSGSDGKEFDAHAGASSASQFIQANVPLKDLALKTTLGQLLFRGNFNLTQTIIYRSVCFD